MCPKLAKYGILFGEEAGIVNTDTLQKNRTRLLPALFILLTAVLLMCVVT